MEIKKTKKDVVKMLLNKNIPDEDLDELIEMLIENPISINVEKEEDNQSTYGDKLADELSERAGSWRFITAFLIFLIIWITINAMILSNPFDPYPFILLNLFLSCIAALQAPIIMMSQNRQSKKDAIRNENDYRTDLKSELILEVVHNDLQKLMKNQEKIIQYINIQDLNKETSKK